MNWKEQVLALRIIHSNMMSRCYNPRCPDFRFYGAKGIRVYRRWHNPNVFIVYIMQVLGPRPAGKLPCGLSAWCIDRKDSTKGYYPGNLQWSPMKASQLNRRPKLKKLSPVPCITSTDQAMIPT